MEPYPSGKSASICIAGALIGLCACIFVETSSAYWIWTPETKKFINPKYAVKDSPKEQFDWAMGFYDAKDYKRSATEFEKLTKHYEFSEYAPRAQYYAGLSYENMGKYYIAFQAYQKAVDNFPHTENLEDIIAKEFRIANIYAEKPNPKILGADIMTSVDRSIEIYRKVIDNAPFGALADEAQYRMGEVMKRAGMFEEATLAFQKVVDDYPTSKFADKAQYEVAQCAYKASLQPAYDAGPTERALKIFEDYASSGKDDKLSEEARKTMQRLKDKAAEKSMITAKFYEQQRHPKSAIIYYQDVLDRYPDSIHVSQARARIEQLQSEKKPVSGGMLGWFRKPASEKPQGAASGEAPAVSKKKGWQPFGFLRKKDSPVAGQAQSAIGVQQPSGASAPAGSIPVAVLTPQQPMPQIPTGTPAAAKPVKKGWDFLGLLGTGESAPPATVAPAPAADPDAPPVAYEEKGSARASPSMDDPNVEMDDDRI